MIMWGGILSGLLCIEQDLRELKTQTTANGKAVFLFLHFRLFAFQHFCFFAFQHTWHF